MERDYGKRLWKEIMERDYEQIKRGIVVGVVSKTESKIKREKNNKMTKQKKIRKRNK